VFQALICDFLVALNKSTSFSYKNHLPSKAEAEGLQGIEVFEAFTKIFQTLICDFRATMSKINKLI